MSAEPTNRLQILWDYFIHAESQSTEKSSWLDVFLAELLSQIKEGQAVKDILSFSSVSRCGVSTLVACEMLSDVHSFCADRDDGDELLGLRKYLMQDRGWRCLATLHLLGVHGLSCGRELVALMIALYPVACQESIEIVGSNPYVKFHCNDNVIDTVDIVPHTKKKNTKSRKNLDSHLLRCRKKRHEFRTKSPTTTKSFVDSKHENNSTESDVVNDVIDHARSLTLRIRLNPMDFEYFDSVVRSDDEPKWGTNMNEELSLSYSKKTPQDFIDERIKHVLETPINNFEMCLLILQLLQALRDYDIPLEQTPAIQVLKLALDILWNLQFNVDSIQLSSIECTTLKAAAARLMLTSLQQVLQVDELTTAVIHNGLLPMTLRLLEDACGKSTIINTLEEGSLQQEFVFATIYGIITFLYCLLQQRGTEERLKDFLELFQLFSESQDGKLVGRTILSIVSLPSINEAYSVTRARKIIDMIGALVSSLKRIRRNLCHTGQCHKTKHKFYIDRIDTHHHFDILGTAYSASIVGSISERTCCVSVLFMTLIVLLKESYSFHNEIQVRLLKVATAVGTCCCFPAKTLLASVVQFLKKHNSLTYGPAMALLERTIYKELGGYSCMDSCNTCNVRSNDHCWDFLELYRELLDPQKHTLCHTVMAHLLKVTPTACFFTKLQLLMKVFYPTFLRSKQMWCEDKNNVVFIFLIQSCVSAISCLISNVQIYCKFIEVNGLNNVLSIMSENTFIKSSCALLEMSIIMEISKSTSNNSLGDNCCANDEDINFEKTPALKILFKSLMKVTTTLCEKLNIELYQDEDTLKNIKKELQNEKIFNSTPYPFVILKTLDGTLVDVDNSVLENNTHIEDITNKTDWIIATGSSINLNDSSYQNNKETVKISESQTYNIGSKVPKFYEANVIWRTAARVAVCSPKFRTVFSKHPISKSCMQLVKSLAVLLATDQIADTSKLSYRLLEALITCYLTSPLSGDRDVIGELEEVLMDMKTKLGRGISALVEGLLRVSVIKPSYEQIVPVILRPRLPTMTMESVPECADDDSSTGEYITADDGYEADIEVTGRNLNNNHVKKDSIPNISELQGHGNAHPALCSLAINLLIQFSKQDLDEDKIIIVATGLRKIAVTCRENISSCSMLARKGVILKLLTGFRNILTKREIQYQDLQHAVLEIFTLLAAQAISPNELIIYLSFFKTSTPPLLSLLQPLFHVVLSANLQPNFILAFPVVTDSNTFLKSQTENQKHVQKTENMVNNLRKKHLAAEICSPWSVHATCLPVGPELTWSVWLHGCSISMWIRVERGSTVENRIMSSGPHPFLNSNSESLSDWGFLSDNWSREVVTGSKFPPVPTSIIHIISIGFESLVLEMWVDLISDKIILRLTRPDDKTNRTISESTINGMLPSGVWHHLSFNCKDAILNKHSAVVNVTIWVDGWREVNACLPFDGLLVKKPGPTCVLLGQMGSSENGAWYFGNLLLFRCPVFNRERALYLTGLGPNYTNLAECILNNVKPNFAPLITSGALNGIREVKFDGGKFDISRRKSYGGTYLTYAVETKVSDNKINWENIMDATKSQLCELQDNVLLSYEAQKPHIVHLYPQAVANPSAIVRTLFPSQPGFRVASIPEHRVSQQPPLSVSSIISYSLECQQYRGLIPAASLIGGVPIFLYLFARVVELHSSEEEQALALSIVLHLIRSDSELSNQYRSESGSALLLRILESSRCHAGRYILKAILDTACDRPILIKDTGNGNHIISQNCEAVIIDPELIKRALEAWKAWAKYDTFNVLLQVLLLLLRDQHSQREFNAAQLNRIGIVNTVLTICKEHFLYEEVGVSLDTTTGSAIVDLIRALMGAPPEFAHLVAITDYLLLVHHASDTYVTHSKHNIYFFLPPLDTKKCSFKFSSATSVCTSNESLDTLENSKLNKALKNTQIQKDRLTKRSEQHSVISHDTSAGEDSGIAASDVSHQQNEKQSIWTDERRVCQGLICEGLLLLLRDALRVLPDSQIESVLKHVIRPEILLVLANNANTRVRTALIKVIQTYLQRANDEEVNKFVKQKYFVHLANQISLYSGSEPLVNALENLVLRSQTMAAMPPLLAMMAKTAAADPNIARPIVSFITDIGTKNSNTLRTLLEQGLIESLVGALVNGAHKGGCNSLFRDIHVLFVAIATKLLESPGSHHMQALSDVHLILNHAELMERSQCGPNKTCVLSMRDAQVALFDGELDTLATKVMNHSGFRLKSTTSYLASALYLTTGTSALTTSSEQSDHISRSSSFGSLHGSFSGNSREPGKAEIDERFRIVLNRAAEFVTATDEELLDVELQLAKRLFSILLQGLSSPLQRKMFWGSDWSTKSILRKNAARIMVWLLGPHQSDSTRVYTIRSLMDEPKIKDILFSLLEVHPQIEQKFTVFFWDLLSHRDKMPSAEVRLCNEFHEALNIWHLMKNTKLGGDCEITRNWEEELNLLRNELVRDREIWVESTLAAVQRIEHKYEGLVKLLTESAMMITRIVVEEQNKERKVLMERLKHSRALEAQAMARWRDLIKRLTHEMAPWHFPESYPRSWELDPTEGPARVRKRLQRCHLKIDKRFILTQYQDKLDAAKVDSPLSYLFNIERQNENATALIERLHTSERIRKMSAVKVVTPRAELSGEALIGESCLYFVPDNPDISFQTDITLCGLDLASTGGTAWRLEDIREIYRRRYQLQERAIEIFLVTGRTYLIAFNSPKERDEFAAELSSCNLPRRVPGDDLGDALSLWRSGNLTNWEYIMCLNKLAGRSYNDLMQYPVFPFVLADYVSGTINLNDPNIYRNFKRPMAVQDKKNEQHYINNYNYLKQAVTEGLNLIALNQEPFHYGSHYSNSGTVLHFLVRLPPFTSMFLSYQDDNFDIPDRTFHALATTWRLTSCDSTTDVKELIPEFFYLPEFLLNSEGFDFGIRQNGNRVGNVELPSWCGGDARIFILAHRTALESDLVREVLPYWIDLVFGFRQTGKPAVDAINVFHPATYYGFDVEKIVDPLERQAWETMIRTYGQTPAQLFKAAHPLPVLNIGLSTALSSVPRVIEGVDGIKWGNYVGAPGNDLVLCWKQKHRSPLVTLVPVITGDVFGLSKCTTLLLNYNKEKSMTVLGSTSIVGGALVSWSGTDGIVRLKSKKEQPPKPLIKSSGHDPINVLSSAPDCRQLWIGYISGQIVVYSYNINNIGKIEFDPTTRTVLLAHRNAVTVITLSRAFSVVVSSDSCGLIVIWDLNNLSYVRSVACTEYYPVSFVSISETLGDIAVVHDLSQNFINDSSSNSSEMKVYTINAKAVGCISSKKKITALCYSNAPEGVSVNVIATGLDNGVIRLWSSWDLRLVREIVDSSNNCGAIIAISWSLDQHHLYAATNNSTIFIWEDSKRLNNGTPKFVDLTSV